MKTILSQYKLLIFDLDDTLISTSYAYKKALYESCIQIIPAADLKRINFSPELILFFAKSFGTSNSHLYFSAFIELLKITQIEKQEKLIHTLVDQFEANFLKNLDYLHNVEKILKYFFQKVPLYIVSNGNTKKQLRKIEHLQLNNYFYKEHVFISGNYAPQFQKPSSYMLNLIINKNIGVQREKIIFIGDKSSDILAGQIAGIDTGLFCINDKKEEMKNLPFSPTFTISTW